MQPVLTVGGIGLQAVSVGGLETCIEIPAWRIGFDIGRCPPTAFKIPRLLFTHAHCDHMGGVIHHCATRDLHRLPPPEYILPAENEADFHAMLDAWRRLDRSDLPCKVRPVRPSDRVDLGGGRHARVFRAVHRVPALGYAIVSTRRKLRPEFRALRGDEIRIRRAAGERLEEEIEVVELAFCGDTTIDVVRREALVRTARVLVLEVTFLDDRVPVHAARDKGHVHLDEVIANAEAFENEYLVFTHFSARYGRDEIVRILERRLPDTLRDRVVPLLPGHPWA